jgi:hypothetical protein
MIDMIPIRDITDHPSVGLQRKVKYIAHKISDNTAPIANGETIQDADSWLIARFSVYLYKDGALYFQNGLKNPYMVDLRADNTTPVDASCNFLESKESVGYVSGEYDWISSYIDNGGDLKTLIEGTIDKADVRGEFIQERILIGF